MKTISFISYLKKAIQNFFIWCSGADNRIFEYCPSERKKYSMIGITIALTGIWAFIAMSYALYKIFYLELNPNQINNPAFYLLFEPKKNALLYTIFFGSIWGLTIFNLDRFIVSSMKKEGKPLKEIGMAIPRIIIAILVSFTISKPIEIKLFEKRISRKLFEIKNENFKKDTKYSKDNLTLSKKEKNYYDSIKIITENIKPTDDPLGWRAFPNA